MAMMAEFSSRTTLLLWVRLSIIFLGLSFIWLSKALAFPWGILYPCYGGVKLILFIESGVPFQLEPSFFFLCDRSLIVFVVLDSSGPAECQSLLLVCYDCTRHGWCSVHPIIPTPFFHQNFLLLGARIRRGYTKNGRVHGGRGKG